MKIVKKSGLFEKVEEYDYIPTPGEVYFYYSGTHTAFTINNPYREKPGLQITKVTYKEIK